MKRVAAGVFLVVIIGCLVWIEFSNSRVEPREFDARSWQHPEVARDGCSSRLAMVPELVRRHLRRGVPRPAIVALLGEPEHPWWSVEFPYPGWSLGKHPDSTDSTGLLVEFDREDRIRAVYAPYWGGDDPYDGDR